MDTPHHENVIVNTNIGIRFWRSAVTTSGYVPFHWHSSIEIVYILKGQLKFTINGQNFIIRHHEFIIVPSGVVHAVSNQPNTAYVFQIPLKVIEPYISHPELVTFINGDKANPVYQQAVQLISQFGYLQGMKPANYLFDSQICFISLLKLFFTKLNNPTVQVPNDNHQKQLIIYISNHYSKKLTVAELAHHFGYNPSYLSRLFKRQMGLSLTNYIYVVKLNHFYDDLVHGDADIQTLFKQNGLTNPRTARKIFQEMFGQLPNNVRRHHLDK